MEEKMLKKLLKLLNKCNKNNEFPVSAIIFNKDKIISYGYNNRNKSKKTISHAEIMAITKANKKIKDWRLNGYNMIVTLEPCDMCKTVIKESRLDKVYYLIERNPNKKQYKNTNFELKKLDDSQLSDYRNIISSFFDNKR